MLCMDCESEKKIYYYIMISSNWLKRTIENFGENGRIMFLWSVIIARCL